MKHCSKCNEVKPIEGFAICRAKKDGRQPRCRICQAALSSAWNKANKERYRENDRARYSRNPEKRKAVMQEIRDRDRDAHRTKMRGWSKAAYHRDPAKHRELVASWASRNPDKAKACRDHSNLMRRGRVNGAHGTHTKAERACIYDSYLGRCAYCFNVSAADFDHVVPLARGGTNDIGNLVPACEKCNASKGAKSLLQFMMYRKAACYATDPN